MLYVPQGIGQMGSGMLQAIHSGTDMLQLLSNFPFDNCVCTKTKI